MCWLCTLTVPWILVPVPPSSSALYFYISFCHTAVVCINSDGRSSCCEGTESPNSDLLDWVQREEMWEFSSAPGIQMCLWWSHICLTKWGIALPKNMTLPDLQSHSSVFLQDWQASTHLFWSASQNNHCQQVTPLTLASLSHRNSLCRAIDSVVLFFSVVEVVLLSLITV